MSFRNWDEPLNIKQADLLAYIPLDRRCENYRKLDGEHTGAVLVTDIVGFTKTTDYVGPKRVIEYLNHIYNKIIPCIRAQNGIVISFSGDGTLCLFDDVEQARLAASKIHEVLEVPPNERFMQYVKSQVKIGIARGPYSRHIVGNPIYQVFDVVSGEAVVNAYKALKMCRPQETIVWLTAKS